MSLGKVLPENILRCIPAAERAKLGKAGQTAAETLAKAEIKNEGDLQKQIISFLRMKGIEPIYQRMDKKTRTKVGTPDLMFAVRCLMARNDILSTVAFLWECKFSDGESSDAQKEMAKLMTTEPNGWHHKIIRTLDEAIADLREQGFIG